MYKESTAHLLLQALKKEGITIKEPFYHATSITNGLKILSQGFKAKAGGPGNDAYYDNAVCFTRNFAYTQRNVFGDSQIIFVLDKNELKQRFKIYPYNWFFIVSKAKNFKEEEEVLFRAWLKGTSKKELFNLFKRKVFEEGYGEIAEVEFDKLIKSFRELLDTSRKDNRSEYEERVSTSNPLTDGIKETHISPKYIKAILVKDFKIARNLLDFNTDFPVFFYNYKTKGYYPLKSKADIQRIPDEDVVDLTSNNKNEKLKDAFHSLNLNTYQRLIKMGIHPESIITSLKEEYFINFKYPQILEMMKSEAYKYLQDMEALVLEIQFGDIEVDKLDKFLMLINNPYENMRFLLYNDKVSLIASLPNLGKIFNKLSDWDRKRFLSEYTNKAINEWLKGEDESFSLILDFKDKVALNKDQVAYLLSQMLINARKGLTLPIVRDLLWEYDELNLTSLPPYTKGSLQAAPQEVFDYVLTKVDAKSREWLLE